MLGHKTSTNASPSRIILSNITQAKLPPCRSSQTTSQYYFVLQRLHKARSSTTLYYKACAKHVPSTTLYYKACTKYFPVLLCTTKLAKSTSQYYFVLQSKLAQIISTLYYKACTKHVPCTTLYYKACTKYFPHKACTQYYFALQSLQKVLPSTTLYYEACAKHFPVLLCTTKLAQSTSKYYFVIQSLHKEWFYTQQVLSQRSFYTQRAF